MDTEGYRRGRRLGGYEVSIALDLSIQDLGSSQSTDEEVYILGGNGILQPISVLRHASESSIYEF
jgi:hypothetical protein